MRKKFMLPMLLITAVALTCGFNEAQARGGIPGILIPPGLPGSSVNLSVNGFLPAPPGVHVLVDSGRPYYVERDRRIYIEEDRNSRHYREHYRGDRRHRRDRDRDYREYRHDRRDHGDRHDRRDRD